MTIFNEFGLRSRKLPIVFFFNATTPQTSEAYRVGHLYTKRNHVTFRLKGDLDGHTVAIQGSWIDNPRDITEPDWLTLATLAAEESVNVEERCKWMRCALADLAGNIIPPDPCAPIRLSGINCSTTTVNCSTTEYNTSNFSEDPVWINPCTGQTVPTPPPNTGVNLDATVFMN